MGEFLPILFLAVVFALTRMMRTKERNGESSGGPATWGE
jgi:hypothetical protein